MKKLFSLLLLMLVVIASKAQVNPKNGFVITLDNDTLWGKIDLRTDEYNMNKCTFLLEGRERWTTFTPDQISGYRFTDNGKYYVSRYLSINQKRVLCFAEYMLKGTMNLYYVPYNDTYYFENEEKRIVHYKYDFDDTHINASMPTGSPDESRRENVLPLTNLLKKSPSALKKVSIYKMYREQLIDIAKAYHDDVCTSNEDCIEFVYDKKKNGTQLHYRIFAGGAYCPSFKYYDYPGNINSYMTPAVGIGVDIALPRMARDLTIQVQATYYLKAKMNGTLYASNDREFEYNASATHLFIDAGVAYSLINSKPVRPIVRAGLSVDKMSEEINSIIENPTRDALVLGGYAGAAMEVPVGKYALNLDLTAHLTPSIRSKFMLQATVGIKL